MDKSIYTAMSGAVRTLTAQSTVSNNLANASTVGFRAEMAMAKTAPLDGPGLPTRVSSTFGGDAFDPSAGVLMSTDRPLDVAVRGNGWIAIQDANGEPAYTRNGELQVDPLGQLVTARGELVDAAAACRRSGQPARAIAKRCSLLGARSLTAAFAVKGSQSCSRQFKR